MIQIERTNYSNRNQLRVPTRANSKCQAEQKARRPRSICSIDLDRAPSVSAATFGQPSFPILNWPPSSVIGGKDNDNSWHTEHNETSGPTREAARGDDDLERRFGDLDDYRPLDPNVDLTLIEKLLRRSIYFIFFILSFDPFAIYKNTNARQGKRYKSYLRKETRIALGRYDRLQERYRRAIVVLMGYLIARYTLLATIQLMIHLGKVGQQQTVGRHSDGNAASLSGQVLMPNKTRVSSSGDITTSSAASVPNSVFKSQFSLFMLELSDLMGNPMRDSFGLSIFIYVILTVGIGYTIGYLPHHYSVKPMDAVNLRFMLDPSREIKRVDRVIYDSLASICASVEPFECARASTDCQRPVLNELPPSSHQLYLSGSLVSRHSPSWRNHLNQTKLVEGIERERAFVRRQRDFLMLMRPPIFSKRWCKELYRISLLLAYFILATAIPYALAVVYALIKSMYESRCASSKKCTFNAKELLSIFELLLGMGVFLFAIHIQVHTIITNSYTQFTMARTIKRNLDLCVNELAKCNFEYENGRRIGDNEQDGALDSHVDNLLFRTLVRLTVSEEELRRNAAFLSEFVSSFLAVSMACLSIGLIAGRLDGVDLGNFRSISFISVWAATNVLITGCASIFARTLDVEKVAWSILAQSTLRITLRGSSESSRIDFIATYWRKLVLSYGLSDFRNSVHPYGMAITYKRVIELNFLVLTLLTSSLTR